ncbi:hypothetical protein MP228_005111 [Amoeboaphelidium protococcarum]|nr:hypothetical protein MP228_005111 [Amoeboaphelidium protococcarum]
MRIELLSLLSAATVSAMYPNWNGQAAAYTQPPNWDGQAAAYTQPPNQNGQAAAYGQPYGASGCARWEMQGDYKEKQQQQLLQSGYEPFAVSGGRVYFRKCIQLA